MAKEQGGQKSGLAWLSDNTTTRHWTAANTMAHGTSPEKWFTMIDSLFQPTSVKQKDVSRYLKKTKKDQKKHHDRHASSKMKELQPRTKVWMQPWTDSRGWKPETVVRHHHTTGSYLIQVENRRKNRRNRHSYKFAHLQDMKFKCRTVSC